MRILLAVLIMAIVWSGYTTAANAFMMMQPEQTQSAMAGMPDCPGMAQMDTKQADHHKNKECQSKCHLCCFPNLSLSPLATTIFKISAITQPIMPDDALPQSLIVSLLRPPKTLA
jgi:hypothetical protein